MRAAKSSAYMTRKLLAALALGAGVLAAPAGATTSDTIHGGCFFEIIDNHALAGEYQGVVGDVSVTTDGSGAPTGATVTCWLKNYFGGELAGTRFSYSGTGVQAGTDQVTVAESEGDVVVECQAVSYADGSSESHCDDLPQQITIPPGCCDTDLVSWALQTWEDDIDPTACPLLASQAGTYPGGVTIDATGDVTAPDPIGLLYDCPPYAPV